MGARPQDIRPLEGVATTPPGVTIPLVGTHHPEVGIPHSQEATQGAAPRAILGVTVAAIQGAMVAVMDNKAGTQVRVQSVSAHLFSAWSDAGHAVS